MIVTLACGDGEARSQFNQNDIGDTDGDGAPEFVDGWGKPIEFLRWAPGYYSPAQYSASRFNDLIAGALQKNIPADQMPKAVTDAIASDRDPFDVFRTISYSESDAALDGNNRLDDAPWSFRLLPLICSGGRDEELGMLMAPAFNYAVPFNPYITGLGSSATSYQQLGDRTDDTITDNITNHLIEYEKRR